MVLLELPADTELLSPEELTRRLKGTRFSLDTETDGLHWSEVDSKEHKKKGCASAYGPDGKALPGGRWPDRVLGLSLACPPRGVATYVPIDSPDRLERFRSWLWNVVSDPATTVVLHNTKFDLHMLGMDPNDPRFKAGIEDTAVMAHLIESRKADQGGYPKTLEYLEKRWLGTRRKQTHLEGVPKKSTKTFPSWTLEQQRDYAGDDAVITYELRDALWKELEHWELLPLFRKEMKYLRILWSVERRGILLDPEGVKTQQSHLLERLGELEQQLYEMVGHSFLWTSQKQLSNVIYKELGVPWPVNPYADADGVDRSKFADRGMYNSTCTSAFMLMEKVHHPIGGLVLAMRETKGLHNRLQRWLHLADQDHVLHTNLNMTATRTGRLSSAEPELQNIPSDVRTRATQSVYSGDAFHRTGDYNLRSPIIARPGYVLLSVDHKQQEMRLFGILSGDEKLMDALRNRRDIHRDVAQSVWGIPDDLHREWSKTISFGLIYGMTTGSLEHRLNKTRAEAVAIADQYLKTYPRIRPYMQEVVAACKKQHYVRYWSGRLWREENPEDMYRAVNALVQGGAADLLSIAGLRCAAHLKQTGSGTLWLPVHDEWLFELREECLEEEAPILARIMEVEDLFGIPFITDLKVGRSYGHLEKYQPPSLAPAAPAAQAA